MPTREQIERLGLAILWTVAIWGIAVVLTVGALVLRAS
jgi:hypothetical protein